MTTQRYEHGALQDEAHDSILKHMRDDPSFLYEQYEKNKERLTDSERERIGSGLAKLCLDQKAEALVRAFEKEEILAYRRNHIERGNRPFDFNRSARVISFFASRVRDLYQTKLAKLMWLTDFASFVERRESVTGLAYARLPFGPAPDRFRVLLALMEDSGSIMLETKELQEYAGEIIRAREGLDWSAFLAPEEASLLERVAAKYGRLSSKSLSEMSHRESIWKDRVEGSLLPYSEAGSVTMVRALDSTRAPRTV